MMNSKQLLQLIALMSGLGVTGVALAEYDFDAEKPWAESAVNLPAFPKPENLLPFTVSSTTDNQFFIDSRSIQTSNEGVIRYALWIKSAENAITLTFEGIRCATKEYKVYALGRTDQQSWSRLEHSNWKKISKQNRNNHHSTLYYDFFCPNNIMIDSPQEAIKALKQKTFVNVS